MPSADPYSILIEKLRRADIVQSVHGLVIWDEQVNLPPESWARRARQLEAMAEWEHAAASDPEIGRLLDRIEANGDALSADQRIVVRRARREYRRRSRLPADFVAAKAALSSEAYHAWKAARDSGDFDDFAPYLRRQLEYSRKEAGYQGFEGREYDYFIDLHDPGLNADSVDRLFSSLRSELTVLAEAVLQSPVKSDPGIFRGFPVGEQRAFLEEVIARMGFDFNRGRLDVAVHPFCAGDAADTRLTTRFAEDNPLDSLFSSIHEAGHGLYEQGLAIEHLGTALGEAVGMAVHESQSRLWENQVGRGRAFWRFFEPIFRARFTEQLKAVSSEELYLAINAVGRTPVRVDADEVTYNLHILLRFTLEKRLFAGDLGVGDLPGAWRDLSRELLGLDVTNDRDGVLQDIHWSGGAFGYFSSYTLGNMIASQLWETIRRDCPDIEEDFARGDFRRLLKWLRSRVHARAARMETLELVREVTGEELGPDSLLRYLRERYGNLYRIGDG